jgi:hypothetical protein
MADYLVPMTIQILIKDIDEDELEQRIDDANFALSEIFYSSDADDDHFELHSNNIHWDQIKEV